MVARSLPLIAALLLLQAVPARATTLIADLSQHLIAITTAFSGADVLLFGNVEDAEAVIVHVRGPSATAVVRRKDRVAGLWLNGGRAALTNVPSFYAIASSAPLEELLAPLVRQRYGIGVEHLELVRSADPVIQEKRQEFVEGFLRTQAAAGLYAAQPAAVRFLGPTLFRTTITFPANTPPGRYQVEVFGIRDGEIIAAQQSALQITKVGLEARITDFASEQAPLYALLTIAAATFLGWLAAVVLRRG